MLKLYYMVIKTETCNSERTSPLLLFVFSNSIPVLDFYFAIILAAALSPVPQGYSHILFQPTGICNGGEALQG